jgi:Uma2 family endonuclease
MTGATRKPRATEADLWNAPDDGHRYELVDGELLRMSPAGRRHGEVNVRLAAVLLAFVDRHRLGHVLDSSTGFRLPGGNIRVPDVAFVAAGRFPSESKLDDFSPVPPDLAVEVLSASDRPRYVLDKVGEYLSAGVRLVWVIDPAARTATAYRSPTDVRNLRVDDALEGEDVLPGFRCVLSEIC